MQKFLSADRKRAVLPGSPRGPGEPWAPTGVPGQKPAVPTTRLSIRTRVPTLKHPPWILQSQLLLHGGLTPGTPMPYSGLTFDAFLGSPRGPRGTWLSGRPSGQAEAVLPTRAVQPDSGAIHLVSQRHPRGWATMHWWFSGRILACHAGDPGPIPGQCRLAF